VKRAILPVILIVAVIGGGIIWLKTRAASKGSDEKSAAEKPAGEKSEETHVSLKRDENGRVVVSLDDKTRKNMGLQVARPAAATFSPELKGYGRALDPAPLAALMTELASAQAAYAASGNELARLKTLEGQGNASTRALQAAEAAAQHDQFAFQSARDRLALSWGKAIAEQNDLPAFARSLTSQNAVLVRVDLPAGETLAAPPLGARVSTLSGNSAEAEFLEPAPNVDPQTQGQGFLFLLPARSLRLLPGEAVTAWLKLAGDPLTGAIIPREAVVRTEGSGWVYVQKSGGDETFTRTGIALDHPVEMGWFVTQGVTTNDYVVVTGAQTLLSEELKSSLKPD
jgi:hypothetical protein